MKFILIFGPQAVGKMTVGKSLSEKIGLPLFYNHMSIELILPFFAFGSPPFMRLDTMFRFGIFKEVAQSDLEGMIFTFTWVLSMESDMDYVEKVLDIFREVNAELYFVELWAPLGIRIERNKGKDRIAAKPSKTDVKWSEDMIVDADKKYNFNSDGDFLYKNHLKINSSKHTVEETTAQIVKWLEQFN